VNGGAGAARNTGLAYASGEFIAFQDSDDLWLPDKLERQVSLLETLPPEIGAIAGTKILYERAAPAQKHGSSVMLAPPPERALRLEDDQFGRMLINNRVSVQNCIFRKDCMPDMSWFDSRLRANEDWDFAIRLAGRTKIYEDHEPVVIGFASQDSISSDRNRSKHAALMIFLKHRRVLDDKPKARSLLLIESARYFHGIGKARSARRFLLAAILTYPAHIWLPVRSLLSKGYGKISAIKLPMAPAGNMSPGDGASFARRPHSGTGAG
jgi:glycosyltransferase involved in cell wall biosynthesis